MTPERKLLSRPGKASLAGRAPRREDTLHPQITPLRPRGPGGIPAGCLVFFFLFFLEIDKQMLRYHGNAKDQEWPQQPGMRKANFEESHTT